MLRRRGWYAGNIECGGAHLGENSSEWDKEEGIEEKETHDGVNGRGRDGGIIPGRTAGRKGERLAVPVWPAAT
jgi:hypothetical protein